MKWDDQQSYISALQELKNAAHREQDNAQLGLPSTDRFANALQAVALARVEYQAVTE